MISKEMDDRRGLNLLITSFSNHSLIKVTASHKKNRFQYKDVINLIVKSLTSGPRHTLCSGLHMCRAGRTSKTSRLLNVGRFSLSLTKAFDVKPAALQPLQPSLIKIYCVPNTLVNIWLYLPVHCGLTGLSDHPVTRLGKHMISLHARHTA